uniref:Sosondowah ankyrin repeat domain family member C n=1 Tax=Salmo trutta TaxID=8032 RepID=A0A674DU04_SALTR
MFLTERGGLVRYMDLIDHFESVWKGDASKKTLFNERLNRHVDSVAFIKLEDGVKFVCLKENSTNGNGHSSDTCDSPEKDSNAPDALSWLDNDMESNGNVHHPCCLEEGKVIDVTSGGVTEVKLREVSDDTFSGGEVKLRDRRRRESAPALGTDSGVLAGQVQVRGSRRTSRDGDCVSVALDPLEHEWMLCASDGQWDSLYPLLILDPSLLTKRDFVTGFSCLHWAAKQGNEELLTQLLEHAKQNNVPVDVNVRSSAGYTPLHLAAMHGHTQVVHVLVDQWSVDPEARDYSGRRAGQYLPHGVSSTAALEPGGGTSPVGGGESDTENADSGAQGGRWRLPRVLQSNLNPLRLLNGSGEGGGGGGGGAGRSKAVQRKSSLSRINARLHRGRHKTQIIHSTSFRGTGEGVEEGERGETSPTSPLKGRPISNLFG